MPYHPISNALLVTGFGVVPSTILVAALVAQEVINGTVDWANLGAVAAIIAMMGFLLTKLLPQMNQNNNETMRHLSNNHKEAMESQRKDFIMLINRLVPQKDAELLPQREES